MKQRFLIGLIVSILLLFMSSFVLLSYTTGKFNDEVWKLIGTTEKEGKLSIAQSFRQGYLFTYSAKNAKNIAVGNRAAVATDLLNYAKLFVNSPAFINDYQKFREDARPSLPEPMKTKERIRADYIKSTEDGIHNVEKVIAVTSDAGVKKALNDNLVLQKKQLEEYKSPGNKMIEMAWEGEQNNFKFRNDEYQRSVKQWEVEYPEKSSQLVKLRLEKFLEITKDIDYNAGLTERNGKKYFINPKYESKSAHWKMAFRAGKEVTETARQFAHQWLKELN